MFYLKNAAGKAHGLFGWTSPEFGLQYRTEAEAIAAREANPALQTCTVARVMPRPAPGVDPNGAAGIFGYRKTPSGG